MTSSHRYALSYKGLPFRTSWVEYSHIAETAKGIGAEHTTYWKDGTPRYTVPFIHDQNVGISSSMLMSHKLVIVRLHCFRYIVSIFIVVLLYISPPCIVDSPYAIALVSNLQDKRNVFRRRRRSRLERPVPTPSFLTTQKNGKVISDSLKIALYLDEAYPDSPRLFHNYNPSSSESKGRAMATGDRAWVFTIHNALDSSIESVFPTAF
jgi:hypothetical protein